MKNRFTLALLHIDGIVRNKKDLDQKISYGEKFA
jgi:hypothetical protein